MITFKDSRGQFSLNGALLLLLVMLLMVLAISILGTGIQSMKVHAACSALTRYIEIRGKVDSSVTAELERLTAELGHPVDLTIEADYLSVSEKTIQYGEAFSITLTEQISVGLGGVLSIPITLHAVSQGRSEQFWKQ